MPGATDLAAWKQERNNDAALHTNQEAIDCCAVEPGESEQLEQLNGNLSLSSIFNHAQKHKIDLRLDSWERTDGCLYLVRELALIDAWQGSSESTTLEGSKDLSLSAAFGKIPRIR